MDTLQHSKSKLRRISLLAVAFATVFVASTWLMLNHGLTYFFIVLLVIFGAGYPALAYYWKRGKGLEAVLFVAALIGGGVLGLNWPTIASLG